MDLYAQILKAISSPQGEVVKNTDGVRMFVDANYTPESAINEFKELEIYNFLGKLGGVKGLTSQNINDVATSLSNLHLYHGYKLGRELNKFTKGKLSRDQINGVLIPVSVGNIGSQTKRINAICELLRTFIK